MVVPVADRTARPRTPPRGGVAQQPPKKQESPPALLLIVQLDCDPGIRPGGGRRLVASRSSISSFTPARRFKAVAREVAHRTRGLGGVGGWLVVPGHPDRVMTAGDRAREGGEGRATGGKELREPS